MATQRALARRSVIGLAAAAGGMAVARRAMSQDVVRLPLPGGPDERALTTAFPGKGKMILQRTRPPLLETPFEVFDQGVLTPNDRFYVRWHWSIIPEQVDIAAFRLDVRGAVERPQSLTMADILALPRTEIVAVNQCSGNSRGFFQPRVAGGQWGNGAMGNARWTGVRLRDVLDRAGVRAGAVAVRLNGLDQPTLDTAPDFIKSLSVDHARDGEVMLAYQMNGEQLPLLNGFPIRVVVPGWYSTYWIKALNDIEVLTAPDDNFWMKTAYRIPDTPRASVVPGQTGFSTVPINRMVPRSFFTNVTNETTVKPGAPVPLRGIAFGGDCGITAVDLSSDGGKTWRAADLEAEQGAYGFRRWNASETAPGSGALGLMVRATNTRGLAQTLEKVWNGGGYMLNTIETINLKVS